MPEQGQGGSQQAGGSSGQAATDVGGDVRQMSVGDLLDLANQQNIDVAPVTELLNGLNLSPEVNVSGTGSVSGGDDGTPPAGEQGAGGDAGGQPR